MTCSIFTADHWKVPHPTVTRIYNTSKQSNKNVLSTENTPNIPEPTQPSVSVPSAMQQNTKQQNCFDNYTPASLELHSALIRSQHKQAKGLSFVKSKILDSK